MMKRSRRSLLSGSLTDCLGPALSKKAKEETPDVSSSLDRLRQLIPERLFEVPPIVLRHQLYSLHTDRTVVDRQVERLREAGEIRLLKLGVSSEDYGLIDSGQYRDYLHTCLGEGVLRKKFTESLLKSCRDVSVSKAQLTTLKFSEEDITGLVSKGVLLVRDVGPGGRSWWFGVPGVSPFIKSLTKGRSMLQQIIGRSKFKEVLQRDVMSRKMTVSKLPMEFHIHDLVGEDLLERVKTTSGDLLRLTDSD